MKEPVPPVLNHLYGTRSDFVMHELKCNTEAYMGSFYPDSVKAWNRIGGILRNSPNLTYFKTGLLASYRSPSKSIYGTHDPVSIKWLFQLRVGLSPLREHKRNHNFLDTPSKNCYVCEIPENSEHFLLFCSRYTALRLTSLTPLICCIGNSTCLHL